MSTVILTIIITKPVSIIIVWLSTERNKMTGLIAAITKNLNIWNFLILFKITIIIIIRHTYLSHTIIRISSRLRPCLTGHFRFRRVVVNTGIGSQDDFGHCTFLVVLGGGAGIASRAVLAASAAAVKDWSTVPPVVWPGWHRDIPGAPQARQNRGPPSLFTIFHASNTPSWWWPRPIIFSAS